MWFRIVREVVSVRYKDLRRRWRGQLAWCSIQSVTEHPLHCPQLSLWDRRGTHTPRGTWRPERHTSEEGNGQLIRAFWICILYCVRCMPFAGFKTKRSHDPCYCKCQKSAAPECSSLDQILIYCDWSDHATVDVQVQFCNLLLVIADFTFSLAEDSGDLFRNNRNPVVSYPYRF